MSDDQPDGFWLVLRDHLDRRHRSDHEKLDLILENQRRIFHELQELKIMSGTLADQLTATLDTIATQLSTVGTDVAQVATDVQTLLGGMTPGSTITQAMVDQANSIATGLADVDTRLKAVAASAEGAAPPAA